MGTTDHLSILDELHERLQQKHAENIAFLQRPGVIARDNGEDVSAEWIEREQEAINALAEARQLLAKIRSAQKQA